MDTLYVSSSCVDPAAFIGRATDKEILKFPSKNYKIAFLKDNIIMNSNRIFNKKSAFNSNNNSEKLM